MAGVAARGPGAIALAPLATSPRKGDRLMLSPLSAPHGTTELEEKQPLAFAAFLSFFFFKPLKN